VPYIESKLHYGKAARAVDVERKTVEFEDGSGTHYDHLISTMPLDLLVAQSTATNGEEREAASKLVHNSSYIVGVGVKKRVETSKCWIYYPEDNTPFYRVTYLSNYSPHMVPDADHILLLSETTRSPWKPEPGENIVERVVSGMIATGLLDESDRANIVTTHRIDVPYEYPVPTIERDDALSVLQPFFMSRDVYSRGRFGAWQYEIGNMDHSVMQGVEVVDRILRGAEEVTWKPASPSLVASAAAAD
jgi:protoporphyrinogen oxidase